MLENLPLLLEKEELNFDIPAFIKDFFNENYLNTKDFVINRIRGLSKNNINTPESIEKITIVQLFLNHFTAYKNNPGSLLKTMCILPLLKEAGFNSIMLLPHFLRSEKFRKGDRGSPYSVKDYYVVDPELNETQNIDTGELFKAFVEACHNLGILVFMDMVPRTAARDSNWILESPDWFYWIKPENSDRLISLLNTHIPELPSPASPTKEFGKIMIQKLPVKEIAALFSQSPKKINPEKWDNFIKTNKNNSDFLDELRKEFGIVTPPCTSDCANDPQPPWADVTPLRLYEDYAPEFYEILGKDFLENSPPFFIQPILKASVFKGSKPQKKLWDKIANVPLYYKEKFGIDGLRGDMFHALPDELISQCTKKFGNDFILIMENLNNRAGEELSKKHGFHFYTGNLFTVIDEGIDSTEYFIKETSSYSTRILAMPVIGDSPPLFSKEEKKALFQISVSAFLPNSAFGLTADTLIKNKLPLNFGLGFSNEDQKRFIEKMKKNNRKIAYFNKDFLDKEWDNANMKIIEFVKKIIELRKKIFINSKFIDVQKQNINTLLWRFKKENTIYKAIANFSETQNTDIFSNKNIVFSLRLNDNILFPLGFAIIKE